ncbi:hypothetical protein RRG08_038513 [Elysia crispata]|uniref:Uncharacterized protein n=1 Tax=Elysia crispata TaxID=231223 RepID=A0AAE1AH99_9GAST|nr:hypothetical protein RRG08_038513 [Elysia crispata]
MRRKQDGENYDRQPDPVHSDPRMRGGLGSTSRQGGSTLFYNAEQLQDTLKHKRLPGDTDSGRHRSLTLTQA